MHGSPPSTLLISDNAMPRVAYINIFIRSLIHARQDLSGLKTKKLFRNPFSLARSIGVQSDPSRLSTAGLNPIDLGRNKTKKEKKKEELVLSVLRNKNNKVSKRHCR